MDFMLQQHRAKHIYRVPDGLRELCSDISREVLRTQPNDIYCFIADYIDALLITRENAKVAMRVVHNVMLDSESIIGVLRKTGLSLEQIAVAAPRLQKTFRAYLDAVDIKPDQMDTDKNLEDQSQVSIGKILRETGATLYDANRAATLIQAAFRGHYQRMLEREKKGEIQWQRAVMNTMQILRKAGISQNEAAKTATLIQSAYRGYYTRRNIKMKIQEEEEKKPGNYQEPRETIQAIAWLDMMFEDSGLTMEQANEAASIIQKAYRKYCERRNSKEAPKLTSSRSLVVEAILDNLNQRIFNNILERGDFPKELGSREKLTKSIEEVQTAYKELLWKSQYSEGETGIEEEEEEVIDSEKEELQKEDSGKSEKQKETAEVEKIGTQVKETEDRKVVEETKEDQEKEKDQEKQEDQENQDQESRGQENQNQENQDQENQGQENQKQENQGQEKQEDEEKQDQVKQAKEQEKQDQEKKKDQVQKNEKDQFPENADDHENHIEPTEDENIDRDDHTHHA